MQLVMLQCSFALKLEEIGFHQLVYKFWHSANQDMNEASQLCICDLRLQLSTEMWDFFFWFNFTSIADSTIFMYYGVRAFSHLNSSSDSYQSACLFILISFPSFNNIPPVTLQWNMVDMLRQVNIISTDTYERTTMDTCLKSLQNENNLIQEGT